MRRHLTLLTLLILLPSIDPARAEDLVVVVHAERRVELDVDRIRQIYLRQRRFWSNGDPIVPINRDAGSPARRSFDRLVFGGDLRRLPLYWNRAYFRGVLPPATLASDEAMLRYVGNEPRAIGYLPRSRVDGSVRIVLVLGELVDPTRPDAPESRSLPDSP